VLPYAPHAAWVRLTDGDIADAIERSNALRQLPDVEHVEPEMLSPSVARGTASTASRQAVPRRR